jgi:hypothetical protein
MTLRGGDREWQCWTAYSAWKHVWIAFTPVPNEFSNDTTILTLESLKSLTFLVGSRRFSEISQGNGYTHFWQTREDQQGAHRATMICKDSGKLYSVHIVPIMIWQNLATMGANLESGVVSSLDNDVVIVMREKGCDISSGHGAQH